MPRRPASAGFLFQIGRPVGGTDKKFFLKHKIMLDFFSKGVYVSFVVAAVAQW